MKYLVMAGDGRFATDSGARHFSSEYPDAWLFDSASDAYRVATRLRATDPEARAISEKAYAEDKALDAEVE